LVSRPAGREGVNAGRCEREAVAYVRSSGGLRGSRGERAAERWREGASAPLGIWNLARRGIRGEMTGIPMEKVGRHKLSQLGPMNHWAEAFLRNQGKGISPALFASTDDFGRGKMKLIVALQPAGSNTRASIIPADKHTLIYPAKIPMQGLGRYYNEHIRSHKVLIHVPESKPYKYNYMILAEYSIQNTTWSRTPDRLKRSSHTYSYYVIPSTYPYGPDSSTQNTNSCSGPGTIASRQT